MTKPFLKYTKDDYSKMERRILDFWDKDQTFQKSVDNRPSSKAYIFYDGPPFITGLPHHGTLLSSIIKDVIPRLKTMQGWRVERRWGWDCHGLPAEHFVEKKLNLKDKQAVLNYGLEKYIIACRENMIQVGSLWEETINRIGRWVEFHNAYKTMDADYMESVWWAFKQLYDQDQIYEGEKVLMYCTRCATPVSKAEIAMDNSYKEIVDTSLYVNFSLSAESCQQFIDQLDLNLDTKALNLIAWTTTAWTLPANTALAVRGDLEYVLIEFEQQFFVVASKLASTIFEDLDFKIITKFKGSKLAGLKYKPLFENQSELAHRILIADYVSDQEGSGIVHLAPAYGEEDYELALKSELPIVKNIDDYGCYTAGNWQGENIWQVDDKIIQFLSEKNLVFKTRPIKHNYPHCHRCQTKLMYKAHASWFFKIAQKRQAMLDHNQDIYWFPTHIKNRRFKDIVKMAPDWNISRDRIWATPLPVWRGTDPVSGQQKTIVIGSYEQLKQLSGTDLEDYHRPWIDNVTFVKDGITYKRVDKVLDCWFESGSMPFAQYHYPFENKASFEESFPADFIAEYVGQVRTWFYYLHAVATGLFDKPAFKNVIVTGTLLGSDGRKMSKSLGNYTDPLELLDQYSADAYRLNLMASPVLVAEDFIVADKEIIDKQRKLDTLRNTLGFFLLYASADDWQLDIEKHTQPPTDLSNIFDEWLMANLSHLIEQMNQALEKYNLPVACKLLIDFIDDLSNWYVRRNRKRFWKTDNDQDKEQAYHSLYYSLYTIAHLIAPVCPFLAEEIYQYLTQTNDSVHLSDWPSFSFEKPKLIKQMSKLRMYVSSGLALRAEAGIKVRQPLASLTIYDVDIENLDFNQEMETIILEELNIKQVILESASEFKLDLDTKLSLDLQHEGLIRELVRHIQALRKEADLEVSDRIKLSLNFSENLNLKQAITKFKDYIKSETLVADHQFGLQQQIHKHQRIVKMDQSELSISLEKA